MQLSKINLNLLVALDALLTERQVTRAAQKVFITQSAMSVALAQLRELLGDELLVRRHKEMVPTPRALTLQPEVSRLLCDIKNVIYSDKPFCPNSEKRTFRMGMSDYSECIVLPGLIKKLQQFAPNISLKIIHVNSLDQFDIFESEQLDLAIGVLFNQKTSLMTQCLFKDKAVCLARKNHPLLQKPITLEKFLKAQHIAIQLPSTPVLSKVDTALEELGVKREVALWLPHMMSAFYVLKETDYLLVGIERMAQFLVKPFGLSMRKIPFLDKKIVETLMAWPKHYATDAAHIWLRNMIACHE